jgi:Protein of unknown function (DUF3467)
VDVEQRADTRGEVLGRLVHSHRHRDRLPIHHAARRVALRLCWHPEPCALSPEPFPLTVSSMNERKQINFTIVPDDTADLPRTYANFCAISHTPFDFTLAFCEVLPLSEKDIQNAEAQHIVRAPVRSKIVVPLQVVPNLIAALQEHMRVYSESTGQTWDPKGPVH